MLLLAAKVALPTIDDDPRSFWLGCVGIRKDGVIVSSRNGSSQFQDYIEYHQFNPNAHAEGRVLRKLGKYGSIFVSRVAKKDGSLAMARPCPMCQTRIKSAKISKVYYSINNEQYGIWYTDNDYDKVSFF